MVRRRRGAKLPLQCARRKQEDVSDVQKYRYTIQLRFWQLEVPPDAITAALDMVPKFAHVAGAARVTPKGTPLSGVYREHYWSASPLGPWCGNAKVDAETQLDRLLLRLEAHGNFIRELTRAGTGHLQVSSFGRGNYALVFPPALLQRCAQMGLSLVHDVYDVEQR
jgi:hypothetical protein